MSGIRSSRPNANAAARQWIGAVSMKPHVVATNSADGSGTSASLSDWRTGWPARSNSMKAAMGDRSAPDCRMPSRYSSKWLMKPSPSSSLSSTRTMSLISLRLPVGPDGTQGTSTHVRPRWRLFSKDMKSHTAKTWYSMNVITASMVLSWRYSGWLITFWRAGSMAYLSFSMAGFISPQSYRDMTVLPFFLVENYRLLFSRHRNTRGAPIR